MTTSKLTNREKHLQETRPKDIDWENLPVAPWEKLPGESHIAWTAFQTYRDMPSRNMRAVARELGRSLKTISTHASRWHWTRRVDAWDRYLDAQERDQQIQALRTMNERHAQIAMHMLAKVGMRLVGDEEKGFKPIDINKLSASDLARLTEVATKIERMAREGEAERVGVHREDQLEVKVTFDVSPIFPQGAAALDSPARMVEEGVIDQEPVEVDDDDANAA